MDTEETTPKNQNDDQQAPPDNDQQETDWQSKFKGQQKVNRDLEHKLNEAYKKADRVDELEKQIAELQGKEAEYEAARKAQAVRDDALKAANTRILKAGIRAAASGRLQDPSDALQYLDLTKFEVSDDGEVNTDAITTSLDELLKAKPYLGKTKGAAGPLGIIPPSGTRDGDRNASQLTKDDISHMTPAQIEKARLDGRLKNLMAGN